MTNQLFSYLMTHDTGFAPNPFFGYLTLATCKPGIRRTKHRGQWVAGFVSQQLVLNAQHFDVQISQGALVYLMQISEVLTFNQYFHDLRFQEKKPTSFGEKRMQCGDNIYWSDEQGKFKQLTNKFHDERHFREDVSGEFVLIAERFYYFGRNCIGTPALWESIGVHIPKGQSGYGYGSDAASIMNLLCLLRSKDTEPGVHGEPCLWDGDEGPDWLSRYLCKPHSQKRTTRHMQKASRHLDTKSC